MEELATDLVICATKCIFRREYGELLMHATVMWVTSVKILILKIEKDDALNRQIVDYSKPVYWVLSIHLGPHIYQTLLCSS